jgi:curved DNA-binding protein CbpA
MPGQVTLYDTLGIEPDATEDEIRVAFRGLSRKHHPDRFMGEEREQAETRFQTITEAFNVLSRPESREKYDRELAMMTPSSSPSRGQDPKELAKRLAAKGAEDVKAGRIQEALEVLKLAIDHDDENARYHYFFGFALARTNGRERDGLRHLERAVSLEPNNAAFKAEAAVVCMAVGLASRGTRLAQDALALDPTNQKASAVLEKAESAQDDSSQGLLGRLRRKG